MIEAVASQCAIETFDERILPRTAWRTENLLDGHRVNPSRTELRNSKTAL